MAPRYLAILFVFAFSVGQQSHTAAPVLSCIHKCNSVQFTCPASPALDLDRSLICTYLGALHGLANASGQIYGSAFDGVFRDNYDATGKLVISPASAAVLTCGVYPHLDLRDPIEKALQDGDRVLFAILSYHAKKEDVVAAVEAFLEGLPDGDLGGAPFHDPGACGCSGLASGVLVGRR